MQRMMTWSELKEKFQLVIFSYSETTCKDSYYRESIDGKAPEFYQEDETLMI